MRSRTAASRRSIACIEQPRFLSDRIFERDPNDDLPPAAYIPGSRLKACIADSFMSNIPFSGHPLEAWVAFTPAVTTRIRCTSSNNFAGEECGDGTPDWWGCAAFQPFGFEKIILANIAINDPTLSDAVIAGLIAHELQHNYGAMHERLAAEEYDMTVNQRVRACVGNNNRLPNAESRTIGMPGEVELSYYGSGGGAPFEQFCSFNGATAFATGLTVRSGDKIDALALECPNPAFGGTVNLLVGGGGGTLRPARTCAAGEVFVGVRGRAGGTIDNLSRFVRAREQYLRQTSPADHGWRHRWRDVREPLPAG